jgi:hypothetical protein
VYRGEIPVATLGAVAVVLLVGSGILVGLPSADSGSAPVQALSLTDGSLSVNGTLESTADGYRYEGAVRFHAQTNGSYPAVEGVRVYLLTADGRSLNRTRVGTLSPRNDTSRFTAESKLRPVVAVAQPVLVRLGTDTTRSIDAITTADSCGSYQATDGIPRPNRTVTPPAAADGVVTICDSGG